MTSAAPGVGLPESPHAFLSGGGEMGERTRAFDWSTSPVGAVAGWPQDLKTAVGICLGSRYPIVIWWGKRDLTTFYNDAYIPILGVTKHPGWLGRSAKECWSEIWHIIDPMLEGVFSTGEATWSEDFLFVLDRNIAREEGYFTFSYSPIRIDSGAVEGIFCAVVETTGRVIGERRLRTLRDLGRTVTAAKAADEACEITARTLAGNPADVPYALIYLLSADAKYARLVTTTGIARGSAAAPERIELDGPSAWPLRKVYDTGEAVLVSDLVARFGPLPGGPWPEASEAAFVLPIGARGQARPTGLLVAGASPRRVLDADYRSFFDLVAGHVATAVANARAYQDERRRAEALAEIDRAKTVFFSNVSHEFRTPLTLMLGPTEEAIAAGSGLSGEALEMVHRNELRLLKLVNTLLEFSRIEAGRVQASYVPLDLAETTRNVASAFRSAVEREGMRLEVDCPPLAQQVFVDRDMWDKIVLNLLSNAFKHTFEGTIRVLLRERDGRAELEVADTGVGVPEAELPRLFERFHRVEGSRARTHEGSGIGLALVNDLVKLHGGEIRARSEVNRGTTFTVSIPAGRAHLPPESVREVVPAPPSTPTAKVFVAEALRWLPGHPSPETAPAPAALPATARIVVADDNLDMRDYMRHLLDPLWEVETVGDGAAALEAARRRRPDLVLADVMMPRLDGFGLLRELRADPELRGVPFLLLSARAGEEARVEGLRAGADDYLVKPFSARELIARIGNLLRSGEARRLVEDERMRMRQLLAQVPAIVNFLRGPELVIEFAHPLAEKRVGRKLAGRPMLEAFPEYRTQGFAEILQRVIATGEPYSLSEARADFVTDGKTEETYWNSVYQPVRGADGAVEGVMTFDIEVTDQVRARRELEMANRSKDEFLAILGHELRNPLAPIRTALELLKLRGQEQPEHATIERQVAQLSRLVDDLLDVARVASGKVELRKKPVGIASILARAVEMAEPLVDQRRQTLIRGPVGAELRVLADENRLVQVLSNVLVNAAKYSPPGRRIWLSASRGDGKASISVRDEGVGIDSSALEEIFQPFVQRHVSPAADARGLGLGLAIARSLVRAHGGELRAVSGGPGRGSEFVIELPLLSDSEASLSEESRPARFHGTRRSILVVDDNVDAALLLTDLLTTLGHEVRVAHDGPNALQLVQQRRPEIVLLDIGLPVMDGYEVARRIRDSSPGDGMKIIAVTGYGRETNVQKSAAQGFFAHLVKPIELDEILRLID